jgi:hypothetical protein
MEKGTGIQIAPNVLSPYTENSTMPTTFEKWNPVTSDFGLIQAPLDRVLSELQNWHRSLGTEYSRMEISSSLEHAFESLLPLSHSKMRRLFIPTHSDWVACFQNGTQGSDPFPAMSFLATRINVLSMRVCSTGNSAAYPAVMWEVYAPESLGGEMPLGYRRSIAASNDGGRWVFYESGERYAFEQTARYEEKRKRDRFTHEMLRDYLEEFGIEPFVDAFYRIDSDSPAVRLQQTTKVWHTPEFSLEQVIAGEPWKTGKA